MVELNLNDIRVSCPLSGGLNSAAVFFWLLESGMKPSELHLYYADFEEHSPDTLRFVEAIMEFAKNHFDNVFTIITKNSVLAFFEKENLIPHPTVSPCSQMLKIEPMLLYNANNNIEVDLIGYVRTEKKRIQANQGKNDLFLKTAFPIKEFTDEWCMDIVKRNLGWYPAIYDLIWNHAGFMQYATDNLHRFDDYTQRKILRKLGTDKRVFKHNNCLPCKNMYVDEMLAIEYFYPEHMAKAVALSNKLKAYWGRKADDYYTTFGKEDYEATQCEVCAFD